VVIDRWASAAAYRDFLEGHRSEYERRSRASVNAVASDAAVPADAVIPPTTWSNVPA
jgi:hypothetical protein